MSAKLAKQAMAQDRPLREIVAEAGVLSAEELDRQLDIKRMTEGGVLGDG
jgi:fumarate hydratase, class II